MRVAALYDIHANLPAFEAVLEEARGYGVDLIVCGGDCAAGPIPVETIELLRTMDVPARFVMGNADRAMVEAFDAGARPEDIEKESMRGTTWAAAQVSQDQRDFLASFEPTVSVSIPEFGSARFCHGSPRSDSEIITSLTSAQRMAPMLEGVPEDVVVCGHTHRQFDRHIAGKRVLNAGSVGMPYEGDAAAFWLLIGDRVEMRRTDYDVSSALAQFRVSRYPGGDEAFRESLLAPADPDDVARYFEQSAADSDDTSG
jgi:putative phosphoesterase